MAYTINIRKQLTIDKQKAIDGNEEKKIPYLDVNGQVMAFHVSIFFSFSPLVFPPARPNSRAENIYNNI